MNLITIILPIYIIIFLGYSLRRAKRIKLEGMITLKYILLNVAVPCLLFHGLATADMQHIEVTKPYLLFYGISILGFIVVFLISKKLLKLENAEASIMTLSSIFPNVIYIGFPMALHILGTSSLPLYFALVLFHSFVTIVPSSVIIEISRSDRNILQAMTQTTLNVALSPMVLSLLIALVFRFTGLTLPDFIDISLKSLGAMAMPLALIILGAEFVGFRLRGNIIHAMIIALFNNLIMPLSAYYIGKYLINMQGVPLHLVILLLATPMGLLPYLIATQYNVYVRRAMSGFMLSNLFAPISMTAVLFISRF